MTFDALLSFRGAGSQATSPRLQFLCYARLDTSPVTDVLH